MSIGRFLVITADDFGIGPGTSHGILDLAGQGLVTATVLLVNSPHAEAAVHTWRMSGIPLEVGWHPCLTLDRPVSPPGDVRSLVDADGRFWPLGRFLLRLLSGRVRADEVARELHAQLERFRELVGHSPSIVNTHHHVQVFRPLDAILVELLGRCPRRPYVRRIKEPWRMLGRIPGARRKRALLTTLGRRNARRLHLGGFPGNDFLAGITDPPLVADPDFLTRWLSSMPGHVVELACHPGHHDTTLIDRNGERLSELWMRRVREFNLLNHPSFRETCARAGFILVSPTELEERRRVGGALRAA